MTVQTESGVLRICFFVQAHPGLFSFNRSLPILHTGLMRSQQPRRFRLPETKHEAGTPGTRPPEEGRKGGEFKEP